MRFSKKVIADILLLIIVAIWGSTFALMKDALNGIKPLNFIFIRFTLAALLLAVINIQRLKGLTLQLLRPGLLLGLALTGGYIFQVSGLQFTTASKAGFITGLSVVIVPVITTFYTKKIPSLFIISGVILATIGLLALSYDGKWTISRGDLLVFFCALSFGLHIFLVGQFVKNNDPMLLTIIQIGVVGIVAGFFSGINGDLVFIYSKKIWAGILYMAVMATGVAFLVQNWAQQFTTSIKTAIIFSMEPVFAMLFAHICLGENINFQSLIGGALIIVGMILAELSDYLQNIFKRRIKDSGNV